MANPCPRQYPSNLHYDFWLGPIARILTARNIFRSPGAILGIRRRHDDRFLLPSHGPFALGAGLAFATQRRSRRPAHDEVEVPVWLIVKFNYPARGTKPPVTLDLVSRGKTPAAAGMLQTKAGLTTEPCLSATKENCNPATANIVCCPRKISPISSPPKPSFRVPSAITTNGFRPAKPAGRRPAISTTLARLPKLVCSVTSHIASGKKIEWDPKIAREKLPGSGAIYSASLSDQAGKSEAC